MENPLKALAPYKEATCCFMAVLWDKQKGHVVQWHRERQAVSTEAKPEQTYPSCVQQLQYVHSTDIPCNSLLSLISSKGHYTRQIIPASLLQRGSSIKSPCNCQELRRAVIRASEPVRNEGYEGVRGGCFFRSYMWNCNTKLLPKHLLRDVRAWSESPRLSGWYCFPVVQLTGHSSRLTAPSLCRKGTAQMYFPPLPIIILLQQVLTGKAMWFFHFLADLTNTETKIFQWHFCVPRLPSASLSAN